MEPTREDIITLKKEHGLIYTTEIAGEVFLWRPLTREENANIESLADSEADRDDMVCQAVVIWPKINWSDENIPGGFAPTLAPIILAESGFSDPEQNPIMFEHFQKEVQTNFLTKCEVIINTAFPEYSIETIRGWAAARTWEYLALAQYKLALLNKVHTEAVITKNGQIPALNLGISFNQDKAQTDPAKQVKELLEAGLDPMMELVKPEDVKPDKNYVQWPLIYGYEDFILGPEWENPTRGNEIEGMLDAARRQLLERSPIRKRRAP